ncbi:FAD:protein FMN transferase [Candidatus Saccharibacteria bacterium]|nr:FAD:protein FMN transferase [Candidatus Saccharibacteria bacterium]
MSEPSVQQSISFEALGAPWHIDIYDELDPIAAEKLRGKMQARLELYEQQYSRFRDDSLVSGIARRAGEYRLDNAAQPLMQLYRRLYELSDGLVTPLIGRALEQAGYDAAYTLRPGDIHHPPDWDAVMRYDHPLLAVNEPVLLDFGAAGKGYAADLAADVLKDEGIRHFCINASGDLVAACPPDTTLTIGLEHPGDPEQVIGTATLSHGSLCGSAGNRRAWGEYTHILNPRSLQSPRHILATWVGAANGLLADGLATALFFMPVETLAQEFTFEYVIVNADMTAEVSADFPGTLFSE